jgi:hypothetical protein
VMIISGVCGGEWNISQVQVLDAVSGRPSNPLFILFHWGTETALQSEKNKNGLDKLSGLKNGDQILC